MQDYQDAIGAVLLALTTSAMGLIGWLVKRTFSHTIPRLAGDFKESLDKQAHVFQEEMRASRTFFQEEIRAQREEFREEFRSQRADLKVELEKLGERIDALAVVLRDLRIKESS